MEETSPRWIRAAPAVFAVLGHALSVRNGFVLDDETLVTENPYLRSLAGLGTLLKSGLFVASQDPSRAADYYRPLSAALNWLSWQLFRDGRAGQHGLNVVMHAGVAMLLAHVLVKWRVSPRAAAIAATIFAVHPATAEIVAYVGGRQDMLGWLFVLGVLAALPGAASAVRCAVLGFAATVLGAFSREAFLGAAAVMPIAAGLSLGSARFDRRRATATGIGVGAGVIVVAAGRQLAGMRWSQPKDPHAVSAWITTAVAFAGRMIGDLIAPTDLVVDLELSLPPLPVALIAIAAGLALIPLTRRALSGDRADRRGIAITGLLVMFAAVVIHTPVALRLGFTSDRYAYPFAVAGALWLAPLGERGVAAMMGELGESRLRSLLPAFPWVLAAALLPATWARVSAYYDAPTLQHQMYEDRPDDPHAKLAEAERLLGMHDCVHALPLCLAYQDRYPTSSRAAPCLGLCYLAIGDKRKALPSLSRYVAGGVDHPELRALLVKTLFDVGDLDGVERTLDQWGPAFAGEPDVVEARRELERRRKVDQR